MIDRDQARAAMIKQTRREIIATLNVVYTMGPFGFEAICYALTHLELPNDECVRRDLTYLIEKGYVRCTTVGSMVPWKKRMYELTAKGNEIANRIDVDPALEP